MNLPQTIELIRKHMDIKALDSELLNRLIDKIVVGDKIKKETATPKESRYTIVLAVIWEVLTSQSDIYGRWFKPSLCNQRRIAV